jgi:sirohydrochlorin cobaltochelatase
MSSALILFAHGARDPGWARPFEALRERMHSLAPEVPAELAYLEFMQPTLADAVSGLAARGISAVTVVPVFLGQGGHLKRDLPVILDGIRAAHPGMTISVTPPIGEQDAVIAAIATCVADIIKT